MAIKALRPPHYSPTCGAYVADTDDSIDHERYEAELAAMSADIETKLAEDPDFDVAGSGLLPSDHPLTRYWLGEHRFDLDAVDYYKGAPVKIRDYFSKGVPTVWTLRRLTPAQFHEVAALYRNGNDDGSTAFLRACKYGVTACSDPEFKLKYDRDHSLSDEAIARLHDADHMLPIKLGAAVFLGYSKAPTQAELFR